MLMLSSPGALLLYLAALLLTLLGAVLKKGSVLSYFGGFFWVFGTLAALWAGCDLREILVPTLLLLLLSRLGRREEGAP